MLKKLIKRIPGAMSLARRLGLAPKAGQDRRFLLERLPTNSVGAEIGVHLGDFSSQILELVKPRKLYLIDPWEHQSTDEYRDALYGGRAGDGQKEMDARYEGVHERFAKEIGEGQVQICRGYSVEQLEMLGDQSLDWVYIDGNHLYEFVKRDLEVSFRKVKAGGFVTGDDYTEGGWWQGGVKRAVDEYAAAHPGSLLELRNRQFIFQK